MNKARTLSRRLVFTKCICALKKITHHRHNLRFHLAYAREDIGMDRVRDTKLTKRLGLELQEILTSVIHGTADSAIFPARMLQVGQLVELGANLLGGPSFLGKGQISVDAGATLDEFIF